MLLQVIQEIAQSVSEEGLPTGGIVGIFLGMAAVSVFMLDRLVFILQSRGIIPTRKGNPNGQHKLGDLHKWYTPDKPGGVPPFVTWFALDEFRETQTKLESAIKNNTETTQLLIQTLQVMQESSNLRDEQIQKIISKLEAA